MDEEAVKAESMYTTTPYGLAQAAASWDRIHERQNDDLLMDQKTT